MFSVIISEKGGAERRETFDRTEINVGRVQGNDLMLPKGNVSKRHARLLYRDGRFIVTDLKSTNGTYVNGRKIAQATIVREGDKIYIGDFVLRIEAGGAPLQAGPSSPAPMISDEVSSEVQSSPSAAAPAAGIPVAGVAAALQAGTVPSPPREEAPPPNPRAEALRPPAALATPVPKPSPVVNPTPPALTPRPPSGAVELAPKPPAPVPIYPEGMALKSSSIPAEPPSSAEKALRPPSPRIEPKASERQEVISHFPLENDPDDSVHFAVPAPPRVPSPARTVAGGVSAKTLPVPGAASSPSAPPRGVAAQPTAPGTPFNLPQPAAAGASFPATPSSTTPPPIGQGPLDRATSPSAGVGPPAHDGGSAPKLAGHDAGSTPKPAGHDGGSAPKLPGGRRATVDGAKAVEIESTARALPRSPVAEVGSATKAADSARLFAQRAALVTILDRVHEIVDLQPLAGGAPPSDALLGRIERALVEASTTAGVRERGDVDLDALLVEARRELCEYGPMTPLFDDEDVTEIQVVRHDYVVALHGRRQVPSEVGFSSEQAVGRAIRRLCLAAGKPLAEGETFVERRLARGGRMFAVLPRAEDHGHMVVIRKPQRADLTLEDLVRSGTISRAMAGLFAQCVAAHANILVTGAVGSGTTTLIGALAGAGSTEDRVMVLQEDDELIFNQPHTISILLGDTPEEGARAVQAAARVRPDRLVVGEFSGAAAAELVDAMGDGVDGVIAGARAPTLRQAVLRLTADIAAIKPGVSIEVAREWLASVFDLAIEIARLRDGRHRVLRVAELGVEGGKVAIRDVFTFTVERTAAGGTIEGSFSPTGVVPGILDDLAARGVPVDPSIFRRHAKSDSGEITPQGMVRLPQPPQPPQDGPAPRSPGR